MNNSNSRLVKTDLVDMIQGRREIAEDTKIPECILLTLIDQIQKRISESPVKNAKMPYYPNMSLLECFKYFNIDIEELLDTDQIIFR